ncbi:MAG: hypothetical protein K2X46_13855 [Roseomonas sp.]|nr:hypothetical protein [Roseomonas sp.]
MVVVVVVPLALASLALLAPVALEEGRLPAGFNPDQWRSLGLLATSQQAPWSLALMGAQRLSMLFGGATAIFLTGILCYVGFAGRLELQRQVTEARRVGGAQSERVSELERSVRELEARVGTLGRDYNEARDRAVSCRQEAEGRENRHAQALGRLETRLNEETRRREAAEATMLREQDAAARVVERFNSHLRELNRLMADQCAMVTPPPRPGSLPPDPDAWQQPAPPTGQRPPARPPFR